MAHRLTVGLVISLACTLPSGAALVLHLGFDGNTDDLSGTGNTASLINGADYSSDSPFSGGQSLAVQNGGAAENQGAMVTSNASLGANPFTLAYWIKPTSTQGNAGLERITSRGGDAFETAFGDANAVGGTTSVLGVSLSYYQGTWNVTNVGVPLNEWSHIAWVNSSDAGDGMELFVNGTSAFTGPGADATRPGTDFMNIGTRHNDVEGFEGLIDDVRLYDTALDAAEIGRLAVPEPSSVCLMLIGLAGFVLRRQR